MYRIFIKVGNDLLSPEKFSDSLNNGHMNDKLPLPQAKHWKREIKKTMKNKICPSAPVCIMMDKTWLLEQKALKEKTTTPESNQTPEAIPVVEGEDPLAIG